MLTATHRHTSAADGSRRIPRGRGKAGPSARGWLLSALVLLTAASVSLAQGTSSTIRGTVKDPQGAVVRGATVTLVGGTRGDERKVTTGDEGNYTFTSVDPGPYTLRVEVTGFKTYQQTFTLSPSETRGIDARVGDRRHRRGDGRGRGIAHQDRDRRAV